jgi:hypothetical protein
MRGNRKGSQRNNSYAREWPEQDRLGAEPAGYCSTRPNPDHSRGLLAAAECPQDRGDSGDFIVQV